MDADDSSDAACFWGYEIPPGGKLSQHVSRHACVCLTGAVLATPSAERAVLRATSGGYSAVLCNLFGSGVHDTAKLGQPFNADFELMVDGASTSAVHVSGFSRGELGPVEIETAEKRPAPIAGGVEYEDVQLGQSGGVARNGQKVTVKYVGTLTNGKRFDAGDISFRLGAGEVIKGWDLGVAGMRVGGKRKLRIPPDAAYGKRGAPPTIPPNATLLFDVELKRC